MSEPTIEELTAEVTTLRSVKDELLAKTHAQKATIATLEAERNAASEAADKATAAMRAVIIDKPVNTMANELCKGAPELLKRELLADFIFDADENGDIVVKTKADGKAIVAKDGKPVAFDKLAMHRFLIGEGYAERTDRQKVYTHLCGIPVASGGVGRGSHQLPISQPGTESKKIEFGLR
jgi:hypothetical protein